MLVIAGSRRHVMAIRQCFACKACAAVAGTEDVGAFRLGE